MFIIDSSVRLRYVPFLIESSKYVDGIVNE